MPLIEDIEAAFGDYSRAFLQNNPDAGVLEVSIQGQQVVGTFTVSAADFAELHGQRPGRDLCSAFEYLCFRRDSSLVPFLVLTRPGLRRARPLRFPGVILTPRKPKRKTTRRSRRRAAPKKGR